MGAGRGAPPRARTSSPPARPGTPPASSASSAPTPTSPSSSATPSRLYDRLEAETGLATGWKMNGGLRLACTPDRWTEVKRQATTARSFGLEMQLLTPAGGAGPLAAHAGRRRHRRRVPAHRRPGLPLRPRPGARPRRPQRTGRDPRGRPPSPPSAPRTAASPASRPTEGRIACEKLVLCAGQWTRAARRAWPASTSRWSASSTSTSSPSGSPASPPASRPCATPTASPTTRRRSAASSWAATSPTRGPGPRTASPRTSPSSSSTTTGTISSRSWSSPSAASRRCRHAGIKQFINGPESFTPDGNFILGEAPEVRNLFVGAGFNAFGIASRRRRRHGARRMGGERRAALRPLAGRHPPLRPQPPARPPWVRTRTLEAYAKHYTMAWPREEYASGRPLRRSPLYDRLTAKGAVFGEKLGWERPNWFAGPADEPRDIYSMQRPNWFDAVGREHRACREAAALFDQTSFAKFMLTGRDAEAALVLDLRRRRSRAPGTLTYTQMLNARGGIECDLTVARLARGRLLHRHRHRLRHPRLRLDRPQHPRRAPTPASPTSPPHYAVLALMGPTRPRHPRPPHRRRPLERRPSPSPASAASPSPAPRSSRLRITYVGELGWELHIPVEFAATVYDALDRRRRRTASPTPATAPSSPCAWKRATAPGPPRSAPTTRR